MCSLENRAKSTIALLEFRFTILFITRTASSASLFGRGNMGFRLRGEVVLCFEPGKLVGGKLRSIMAADIGRDLISHKYGFQLGEGYL